MLQSQSLSSWLLSRSFRVVGFGTVKESLFEMWLSAQLETCAFGALPLAQVISGGVGGLELDQGEVLRLLVRVTRRGGRFKSDGEIITLR